MLHTESSIRSLPSGGALHISGPQGGTPILFLHGVGGAAWSWRHQRLAFEDVYRIFVWEARGHGAATRVPDAGLSDYYTDAKEALDVVWEETNRPTYVVAHSMGGLLAVALACDRAAAVKGLFLIDPVYATGEEYGHFPPALGKVALFMCTPLLQSFERNGKVSRSVARWMISPARSRSRRICSKGRPGARRRAFPPSWRRSASGSARTLPGMRFRAATISKPTGPRK